MKRPPSTTSSQTRLGMAVGVILWIIGVFAWVVLCGEDYIGPDADSAAFIARFTEIQ